jgi:hypothetical protein
VSNDIVWKVLIAAANLGDADSLSVRLLATIGVSAIAWTLS